MAKRDNKGQMIAENIRNILLNADLRLVYAQGELEQANADRLLYARLGTAKGERKALVAKCKGDCYKVYIKNVQKVKEEVVEGLDHVLRKYLPRHKRIWTMYFLERATVQEIASETNYSTRRVDEIIKGFKDDLRDYYKGDENDAFN